MQNTRPALYQRCRVGRLRAAGMAAVRLSVDWATHAEACITIAQKANSHSQMCGNRADNSSGRAVWHSAVRHIKYYTTRAARCVYSARRYTWYNAGRLCIYVRTAVHHTRADKAARSAGWLHPVRSHSKAKRVALSNVTHKQLVTSSWTARCEARRHRELRRQ